jgi:hypothetical protein
MTGFNVALRMRRDAFVAAIDYDLLIARKREHSAQLSKLASFALVSTGETHD